MPSIKHSNYTINPCGCVEGNDISTSCLLRRSTFCFSATVKALHVLEVSSAVSRIESSRRNESAGDTPHGMRVLRGSETPKLHAAKAAEEGFSLALRTACPATYAQLRFLPVDCILLAAKQRFSGRTKHTPAICTSYQQPCGGFAARWICAVRRARWGYYAEFPLAQTEWIDGFGNWKTKDGSCRRAGGK